ncbi:efflux RND transporter periplasmic adaptor subunit [Salinihabitans flavidus]|uniref:efflux RND transporter periplasmic adaptor subunit n=1 Tax=Salinihabitans flavidus TaxID=569882 RepID=UPI001FDF1CE0|nr:efflux RND transporter periplasmic adaptor subunit [Salinihabitans flavidus]
MTFESDRGASRSIWIASAVLVALIAWMGSGFILPSEPEMAQQEKPEPQAPSVMIRDSTAQSVTLTFSAEGQALPDRDTGLRAEASGNVVALLARKGDTVEAGEVIARLSSRRAEADLARAKEDLARARRDFNNAQELLERGAGTVDRVSQARAALAGAEAQLTAAEQELDDLAIVAPFPGRIETLTLAEGEFVSSGEQVGRIVDNHPLTVAIQVPQQALSRIENGQIATVRFITGQTREGIVNFVGTAASSATRTFLAEIEVQNDDGTIPAGVSAEIEIPTGEALAHFIEPSIVSLDPEGRLGVKTVEEGIVQFHPIEIVKAEIQGVWARGLPDPARIITIGQGFVRQGEEVRVSLAEPAEAAPAGTETEQSE